jgi:hypothetical protein
MHPLPDLVRSAIAVEAPRASVEAFEETSRRREVLSFVFRTF